uniref:PiggyBac transposable element-derived protein domain-containing protein n=1 Tax=Vespula pensylvanica TaxID=30213 RepID=A0A834JMF5_VESPE|nr:hypothetical protein H0235_018256 [Vespula pensylvanica]
MIWVLVYHKPLNNLAEPISKYRSKPKIEVKDNNKETNLTLFSILCSNGQNSESGNGQIESEENLLAPNTNSEYIINGFPYFVNTTQLVVVLKLIEPFIRYQRHVTTDNFFTSASLATKLLAKQKTLLRTIQNNRRELPKLMKLEKDKMELFSTILYKSNNCTLTIYKSEPSKKETNRQNISKQQFLLQIAEELAEDYHQFLQEEKENVQGTSSG